MIRPASRPLTRVAVGVLLRADGSVLLADRPAGKPYAGYWEFPGGKIETGEPVAAALARELHEELGVDIGSSDPWVSFEFDYPHAYVELQFRLVRRWRGEPQAREGQQLRFVHPAGELPRPLLPAAVPALRWLRLPQTALVIGPRTPLAAAIADDRRDAAAARLIVVDADWRIEDSAASLAALRAAGSRRGDLLLAGGAEAQRVAGADGVVLRADEAQPGFRGAGWRGLWIGSNSELRCAAQCGADFVLVRSAAVAEALRERGAALPAFLPAAGRQSGQPGAAAAFGHGRWHDLRSTLVTQDRRLAG
jgi:8-oxo-dGTP diphosphatase